MKTENDKPSKLEIIDFRISFIPFLIIVIYGIIAFFFVEPTPQPYVFGRFLTETGIYFWTLIFLWKGISFILSELKYIDLNKKPDKKAEIETRRRIKPLIPVFLAIFLIIMICFSLYTYFNKCNAAFEQLPDEQKQEYYAGQHRLIEKAKNIINGSK